MSKALSSLGSTIPSEALDTIIQCFANCRYDVSGNRFYEESSVRMNKRQLAACSLVCRYWFQRCRPHIIGKLKLRSSSDIDDLLAILRSINNRKFPHPSPVPAMAEAIEELIIVQSGPWAKPWLHDVISRVYDSTFMLRPFVSIRVIIEDAFVPDNSSPSGSKHAPSSLSAYLPKTLPGVFYQFIDVDLFDLRFRRPLDLIRMLNDIPMAYRISLNKISFTEGVEDSLPERIWRPHPNLTTVNIFKCGEYTFEVRLLFHCLLSRVRRENDALGIILDARPALQDIAASCAMSESIPMKIIRRPFWIELVCYQDIGMVPTHHIQYQLDAFELADHSASRRAQSYEPSFTFTLCSQLNHKHVKTWDWKTIDDVLCTLHPRPFIEFLTSDANTYKWFLRGVREGVLLKGRKGTGKLDVHFLRDDSSGEILCSLEDIQSVQAEYIVDGKEVRLNIEQRFDIWRCPDGEKDSFLRALVANINQSQMSETALPS